MSEISIWIAAFIIAVIGVCERLNKLERRVRELESQLHPMPTIIIHEEEK